MAIYSEPVPTEKLLEQLSGVNSVGIAGCLGVRTWASLS